MKFFSRKIIIFLLIIAALFIIFNYTRVSDYITLETLQARRQLLQDFVQQHYLLSVMIYIGVYSLLLACAMPVVIPLALVGGFLYGIFFGFIYAGLSCLIGSLISFLALRFVVVHWIRGWHNERIEKFNAQVQKYGYSYLLILHFLSIVPLFVINLLAAVANVPLFTVIWVTIVGTSPLNFLCVVSGQKLSTIQSAKDIFSPTIILLFVLLALVACVPLLIKKIKGSFSV